jgi:hypothetical protein
MIHIMDGVWKIGASEDLIINCGEIYNYIKFKEMSYELIEIDLIGHKELQSISTNDHRYVNANTDLPGILVNNMENPRNKKYRLIDGRHRLLKTINSDLTKFKAYVLERDEAMKFVRTWHK